MGDNFFCNSRAKQRKNLLFFPKVVVLIDTKTNKCHGLNRNDLFDHYFFIYYVTATYIRSPYNLRAERKVFLEIKIHVKSIIVRIEYRYPDSVCN